MELAGSHRVWPGQSQLFAGFAIWTASMVLLPAPLAARILLLAPLVVVPRLLATTGRRPLGALTGWPSLAAAMPLVGAYALPSGPVAAALALPWLAMALVGTGAALLDARSVIPAILDPRRIPDLGLDVALGFWGVAGTFTVVERLGLDVGFGPTIILLTAVHFHFAGFALTTLASRLAARRPWLRLSVLGMVIGMPVTALGFILPSDALNAAGALLVGLAGIGVAVALLTTRAPDAIGAPGAWRWLSRGAGATFLVGMPMGIAWSLAILTGTTFLDLDTMVRTHGVLNAIGVLVGVMSIGRDA